MIYFATYLLFLRTSFQLKFFRMTTEDHREHGVLVPLHRNVSLYISAGILQVLSSCCNCALQSFTYAAGGADGWRRRRTRRTAPRGRAGGRLWRRRRRHRDGYCPSLRHRRRVHQRCRLQRFPRLTAEVGLGRVLRHGGPPLSPGRAGTCRAGLARSVTNTLTLIQRRGRWRRRGSGRRVDSGTGRRRSALCW